MVSVLPRKKTMSSMNIKLNMPAATARKKAVKKAVLATSPALSIFLPPKALEIILPEP